MKLKLEIGGNHARRDSSALLLSMDQFEGLMETIEILSDEEAMRGLRRSLKQAEKGQWVSHGTVFSFPATKSS